MSHHHDIHRNRQTDRQTDARLYNVVLLPIANKLSNYKKHVANRSTYATKPSLMTSTSTQRTLKCYSKLETSVGAAERAGAVIPVPKFKAVGKLSKIFPVVEKFSSKNAKFRTKHFLGTTLRAKKF